MPVIIVDNECNTYYLPHDYAEIINDALKLHSSIYNECDTDSCRRQIITKLEILIDVNMAE